MAKGRTALLGGKASVALNLKGVEILMLKFAANTLIKESCSAKAIAQALRPSQWLEQRLSPGVRRMFRPVLIARDTPRLLRSTRHLVAIAKRYLMGIARPKYWSYDDMVERRGTDYVKREITRRDKVYGKILRDAKKLLTRRKAQHASTPELLAIRTFIDALKRACDLYRPNHGPTLPQPGSFRSVEVPVSRDYPHTSGRN